MSLDDDLRRTLRRQPAPAGFVDRVLARRRDGAARSSSGARGRAVRWLTAAAAAAVIATGAAQYIEHYQHRRLAAEARRVQQDLDRALQVTSEKLALVKRRLHSQSR